jgi:CDP-glycerol glycerophosphotransferase (TagB/SpsB family)
LLSDVEYPGPAYARSALTASDRLVRVPKNSPSAVLLSLTAETTFFTHGLFSAVPPPANRLVVNLWHGDGPKLPADTDLVRSTVAVAGTKLWGSQRAKRFGLPPDHVAILGNPRIDQFTAAPRAEVLSKLGLDPDRRTLLWLPTYRTASGPYGRSWNTTDNLSTNTAVAAIVAALGAAAHEASLQLVVKPHPLDADVYGDLGIRLLPHKQLSQAGVTLYQLLGAADAIISDVSSVWPDFLSLDRPIGFYVPDLEELQSGGWLNVEDLATLLPGPRIENAEDARQFVEGVAHDPDRLRPSRYPAYSRVGPADPDRVTDRLLDWLDDFQRGRGRKPLFSQPAQP